LKPAKPIPLTFEPSHKSISGHRAEALTEAICVKVRPS
jgi:hypothetical protein